MSRDRSSQRNRGNGSKPADKPKGEKPHYVIRYGQLKLSCWRNESDNGVWYSCKLVRIYKDGETWKDSASLNDGDLANAAALLLRANHELQMERGGSEDYSDAPAAGEPKYFEEKDEGVAF